nr:ribonuclease H-like domain-containing protein [Tanacetum cinerariifolium]
MFDEYNALIKNKTWTSVPRPEGANIVRYMWLFCHTFLVDGTLSRYKARLVVNGSTQVEGVDVDETFSPVVKPATIRTILSLAIYRHWPVHQLDVKNAFLHGDLAKTIYMHQPPVFWDPDHPNYVCLLQRSLYGLKQIIAYLHHEFSMTDLGALNYFLGILVTRDSSGIFLSQQKYAIEILERAHMVGCTPSRTRVDIKSKLGDGDTDLAGCLTMRQFTLGYCVFLGNNLLLWSSKRQPTLSHSSAEAEYHGVANAVAETCWIWNLHRELHTPLSSATIEYCDNVRVLRVPFRFQFADILTKGLPSALFDEFRDSLSVRYTPALIAGVIMEYLGISGMYVWSLSPSWNIVERLSCHMRTNKRFINGDKVFWDNLNALRMKLSRCVLNPPNGPFLETLELYCCNGVRQIDVASNSVKKLVLFDYGYVGPGYIDTLEIDAPYILSLTIKGKLDLEKILLLNISSLIKAELVYVCTNYFAEKLGRTRKDIEDELLKGLLTNLRHANMVNDDVDMITMVSDVCAMISKVNLVGINHGGWWMDTGETRHTCADKSLFHSFKAIDNGKKLYMGDEYLSPFAELCAKHGIRHEFMAPYSPQRNGIAERKNCTLKEMVTAMLISS